MLLLAKRAYHRACQKTAMLGLAVSNDPAWKMLLDLYISNAEGRLISVSDACVGSGTNSATALRYLSLLEGSRLVTRNADALDRRRFYVSLTIEGVETVVSLLA
ncbi:MULTISPECIES: hypothetical protein [unclassified Sphingomonas]|uniref:hypothetical protein n=1 Tax=unclassified Sphingomonas TaxID=196159 RepID=UPI00226AA202|nr:MULTISPECIES: hypothetical protein [unclassified Sphingomonas]